MSSLPAITGWNWIKQGFVLFRKRPRQFSMLFTTYLLVLIALMFVPFIGSFIQAFFAPIFSMIFMMACAQIDRTGELNPLQLRASFAPPVSKRMFTLGGIYLVVALLLTISVVAVFSWMDGGSFIQLLTGIRKPSASPQQDGVVLLAMLAFFLIFMPPLWYAAPLIVWQKFPVFQAMFYSFFSVIRAARVFFVYFLSWMLIGVLLPALLAGILSALVGKAFALVLLFLLTIFLSIVLYCSFYQTYVDVFGKPELPDAGELKLS
jgi:hypothetical protein